VLTNLQGQIERITYFNEENGYTVAKVKVYNRNDLVTVVGNLLSPTPGGVIKMKVEWANNPKYGEQFKVVHYKSLVPALVSSKYSTFLQILADFGICSHSDSHTESSFDLLIKERQEPFMISVFLKTCHHQ
jgi:hypothetical protein